MAKKQPKARPTLDQRIARLEGRKKALEIQKQISDLRRQQKTLRGS